MAPPPDEAEVYRLDRIQTRKLNDAERDTLAVPLQKPKVPAVAPTAQRAATAGEQALRSREEQALDAWRQRGIACRAGNHD